MDSNWIQIVRREIEFMRENQSGCVFMCVKRIITSVNIVRLKMAFSHTKYTTFNTHRCEMENNGHIGIMIT